jgi:hypothetical protein
VEKISLICTVGTAFIGIVTAVLSFSGHPLALKVMSIVLAAFGVVLSLLKGSSMFLTSSLYANTYTYPLSNRQWPAI